METSALQSVHEKVSSDIFPGVFDWMFEDVTFQRWRQGQCAWQLHCIGGPGSGKVSISVCTWAYAVTDTITDDADDIDIETSQATFQA